MRNYNKPKLTMSLFVFISTMLSILSGLLLSSHVFAANTGNMNASVNITAACSLSIAGTNFSTSVIPGNSVLIGTSTVTSICNDPSGLAVYVVGYTNDSYGNNNLTATINETAYNIPASTSAASRWNMTIKGVTGTYAPTIVTTFDNTAQPIPDQYTKVAYRNTITDLGTGATGAKFTTDFNAHVDMTQPAGTYVGKVKFLLIHPNILTYNDQTGEPATFAPDTLASDPEALRYMQDVATWGPSVAAGQEVTAIDRRDSKTYTVARLADGNLWMTQNLDLDIDAETTYTHTDTDLPVNATWTPNASTIDIDESDPHWTSLYYSPQSYNPGDLYWTGEYDYGWTAISSNYYDSTGDSHYHLGNYYNWTAAIASNDSYDYFTESYETQVRVNRSICPAGWTLPSNGNASENGSFRKLFASYGFTVDAGEDYNSAINGNHTIWDSPLYLALSGWMYNGESAYDVGFLNELWTSALEGDPFALQSDAGYSHTGAEAEFRISKDSSYNDASIRCVAR